MNVLVDTILFLVILVILTEAVTELSVKSDLFEDFREFVGSKHSFLDTLVSCGYCFSVWVSVFINSVYLMFGDFYNISGTRFIYIDFIVSVILVHRLSNYLHGAVDRFFSKGDFNNEY